MALTRRERQQTSREAYERWPFDRGLFEWPVSAWRRMVNEDEVKVEEFTEGDELVVRAELPGVDPDKDIDVSIVEGALCIRAERRHEERTERRDYRRTEIRYGSFSRVLPLPSNAKESDIKANYKDGILEVRAPMQEPATGASRIPIGRA